MKIKLIITDIDGVWTDAGMYYDNNNNELKKFNTYDSAGINFCKIIKIPVCVISGENQKSVKRRTKKLKIEYVFLGIDDKVKVAENLIKKLNIDFSEVAFIGDDINDYKLLSKVGFSAAPSSAPDYIKKIVKYKLKKKGGEGVFREFIEKLLLELKIDIQSLLINYKG